ncbi:PspA/IM30 family protein [Neobacillus vireti]|uniref:Phage shock protein PspA n=1 Tax=Neobacillus vireti LMG 21834 TaxID=1131730 RepID=A0AB94ITU8_9BACI|nr:PspA/IM30 family protein [Neobacillus vireti]ETI70484.1 phage shock protein PspA [Neobacillus vireti LMG 21834]KLT19900.1 modulator protein [Neobacillus vireti]
MGNLFTRIKDVIVADLNETLHQKEKQNPIAKLNQYLRRCEQETAKVGKLVERQSQLKDEFRSEHSQAMEIAEKRKYQAEIALKAGEEELCQFATAEYQQYSERAERLNASLAQISEQLQELERKHEEMKRKLKDMQLRRMELMGRENVTRANIGMNQMLESDSYTNQSNLKFKDIDTYLDRLEQKVTSYFKGHTIDAQVAQLEKEMETKENNSLNLIKE